MRTLSLIFFAFFSFNTTGQTYSSIIADSTIISFMEWEIKNGEKFREGGKLRINKKVNINIVHYDTIDFILPDSVGWGDWEYYLYLFNRRNKIDSLFSKSDRDSIFHQFTAIKDTVWTHGIGGARWKKWKNPKNTYEYAVPLFSPNGQYVLIKKSFYRGNLCAYGGIYLYQRTKDNSWELLKILNGWMS